MSTLGRILVLLSAAYMVQAADRVVVLGFDGMSPDGITHAATPVMHRLMKQGAFTLHARGVMPTVSSPNWASMIMGAGPEEHGVTSNEWKPDKFQISPVCTGPGGIFPTMFGVLRQQRRDAVIGVFHDWSDFGRLVEKQTADEIRHGEGPDQTLELAIRFLQARKPDLLFVHFDHVDHAGHEFGHGTPEYYAAVAKADGLIEKMLQAIDSAGLMSSTYVLITADHGGVGKKHGGDTMAELEIPWILTGPGVAAGRELRSRVRTYDTAATVAAILKIQPHECWIGRPVTETFAKH